MFEEYKQKYERKFGRDEYEVVPRCIMAAIFRTQGDPTGEQTLKHWISVGQVQETMVDGQPFCSTRKVTAGTESGRNTTVDIKKALRGSSTLKNTVCL